MKSIVAVIVGIALMVPATAFAQSSSSCGSYNTPPLCNINIARHHGPTSAGSLPFTGLDVVLLAAGGATLLGAGLVVRTLSRRFE